MGIDLQFSNLMQPGLQVHLVGTILFHFSIIISGHFLPTQHAYQM